MPRGATATAPAPASNVQQGSPVAASLRSIGMELGSFYLERAHIIEGMTISLLAKQHPFLLGPPGTAKSALVRALCARVTGARYWETLFDRQLPLETIFGPLDLIEYKNTGHYHRRVDGYLPTAHIAFGDETGKAGPAVLNPLLTALNERLYHNNSKPMQIPLLMFVGASNEELEPELAAIWDRFGPRFIVNPIQEPSNFAQLLNSAVIAPTAVKTTTISLDQLTHAQDVEIPAVNLPPGVIDTMLQLRSDLAAVQVNPSDRRWRQCIRLLQAAAWLAGRDVIDEDDLAVLQFTMWDVVEQIPAVEKKVLSLTSPITKAAMDLSGQLDDLVTNINGRKGQSVEERAKYGGEAQHKVNTITKSLNDLIEKANRQGRPTTKLNAVKDQVTAVKTQIFHDLMNVPEDRAKLLGSAP